MKIETIERHTEKTHWQLKQHQHQHQQPKAEQVNCANRHKKTFQSCMQPALALECNQRWLNWTDGFNDGGAHQNWLHAFRL